MSGALDLLFALGRDDLRVVQYCSWEGRPSCRPVLLLGGTTSVSSGIALGRDDLGVVRYRCVRV
jgi:hypothetical protein